MFLYISQIYLLYNFFSFSFSLLTQLSFKISKSFQLIVWLHGIVFLDYAEGTCSWHINEARFHARAYTWIASFPMQEQLEEIMV